LSERTAGVERQTARRDSHHVGKSFIRYCSHTQAPRRTRSAVLSRKKETTSRRRLFLIPPSTHQSPASHPTPVQKRVSLLLESQDLTPPDSQPQSERPKKVERDGLTEEREGYDVMEEKEDVLRQSEECRTRQWRVVFQRERAERRRTSSPSSLSHISKSRRPRVEEDRR